MLPWPSFYPRDHSDSAHQDESQMAEVSVEEVFTKFITTP